MFRITKDRKTKYQSLGISIPPKFWDFDKNRPKRNCPNRDAILRLITEKTKKYQEQLIELEIESKDFTVQSSVEKITRKTVGELFQERIQELKEANRLGYAESHLYVYKSLLKFNELSLNIFTEKQPLNSNPIAVFYLS